MRDPLIVTIMLVTLAITVAIGIYSYWEARTQRGYFAYGQKLRWFALGLATFASIMSGFGFVGGPGLVYSMGSTSLWMTFAGGLGIPLAFLIVGRKLQSYAGPEVFTIPDAVYKRFGSQSARFAVAVSILLGVLAYLGSQVLAAAVILASVFQIDVRWAFAIALAVITIYPLVGGIVAGIRTEIFQGSIMLVASILIFGFALSSGGGMDEIMAAVASDEPSLVGPWGNAPALLALSWFFVFTLGIAGMPHSTSRFLMVSDPAQIRYGVLLATAAYMIGSLLWMSVGFAVRALVATGDLAPLDGADQATPTFLANYTPRWLAGIAFAGVISAILSTASIFLNVGSATLTRDIPLSLNRPLKRPLFWARTWTAVIALGAGGVALVSGEFIALLGAIGFGLHAAGLVPTLIFGLHWRRANASGVIASSVVAIGGSIYFFVAQQLELASSHGWWVPESGLASVAMVMLLSLLTFVVATVVTQPRSQRSPSSQFSGHGDEPATTV
jgi:sodium/proline symporter